jgi:allantoicase
MTALNDKCLADPLVKESPRYSLAADNSHWRLLLPMTKLQRDTWHSFSRLNGLIDLSGKITHLVFIGVPDGGVHRLAVFGETAT